MKFTTILVALSCALAAAAYEESDSLWSREDIDSLLAREEIESFVARDDNSVELSKREQLSVRALAKELLLARAGGAATNNYIKFVNSNNPLPVTSGGQIRGGSTNPVPGGSITGKKGGR